ncbi:MAG TPA: Uma2 family endonuclease [Isosphaeraceae bacterium]|nr:Uma2 family endonuclease [Isosphaeraceae bacterium]
MSATALVEDRQKAENEPGIRPVTAEEQRIYRFSVQQYDEMVRVGILTGEDRVELIEGLLVEKMTKNERHMAATKRIVREVQRRLPEGLHVAKEDPIVAGRSEPEPDVAILRGEIEDYLTRKPAAADVVLLVEVADTTYTIDRAKLRVYARAGIPCCWIANLPADRIEVYTDPTGTDPEPDYRRRQDFARDSEVSLMIDGQEVGRLAVNDLLPPP